MQSSSSRNLWLDFFRKKADPSTNIRNALKSNILFETLSRRELDYLSSVIYERVYNPGEVIFEQGDRGFGMYVIAQGKVAIRTQSKEGETLLTTLSDGSFFGELSLIETENIRSASATALDRCLLIGFFKPDLTEILERKPAMGVKILYQLAFVLGRRLIESNGRLTQRSPYA